MTGSGGTKRYDANGSVIWSNGFFAHHIKQLPDENLLVWGDNGILKVDKNTGNTTNPIWKVDQQEIKNLKTLPDNGCVFNTSNKVVRLDAAGNKLWESDQVIDDINVTTTGEVLITKQENPNAQESNYIISKLNTAGKHKWSIESWGTVTVHAASDGGFFTVKYQGGGLAYIGSSVVTKYEADPCTLKATVTANSTEICAGTSATLTATATNANGAVTYEWTTQSTKVGENKNTLTVTDGSFYNYYRVEITDEAGCKDISPTFSLIRSNPKVTLKSDKPEFCAGGSTTLTAEVADGIKDYTFAWKKDGAAVGGTSSTLAEAKAGTYTVEVTDKIGCKAIAEQKITENPTPTANAGGNVTRYGSDKHTVPGTTATGGTGPYRYAWSTNPGVEGTGLTEANPTFGPFTQNTEISLKVTDSKGCESTAKATVTYSACPLKVTVAGGADYCAGGTPPTLTANVSEQAGTPRYEWKREGIAVGTGASLSASEPGKYTVTVTDDRCSTTSPEVTIRRSEPKVTVSAEKSEFCAGETTTLRASASGGLDGYTYQWKKGGTATGGNSDQLGSATGGSYTVEVTDGKGCPVTSSAQVLTENPKPTVVLNGGSAFCEGKNLVLTASVTGGASPYTYQWLNGTTSIPGNATSTLSVNSPGDYVIRITDLKGCQILTTQKVAMNALPRIRITDNPQRYLCVATGEGTVVSGSDGVLVSEVTSGSVNTYQWLRDDNPLTGATANSYRFTQTGAYTVRVTTAGCADPVTSAPVTVTQRPTDIMAKIDPAGPLILEPATSPKPITLTATSRAGYGYQWQYAPNTGPIENLKDAIGFVYNAEKPGTYYVEVRKDGCVVRSSGVVISLLTSTQEEMSFDVRLHPNPATERVRVEVSTPQPETLRVRLLSPTGGEVGQWQQDQRATSHVLELDLSAVPEGLYFLHLQAGPQRLTRKVIRIR